MKKILFYNADGNVAKTILAGCYKFGRATLLRRGGATMTSVIEYYEEYEEDNKSNRQGAD